MAEHNKYYDVFLAYEKAYSLTPGSEQLRSDMNKLRRIISEALDEAAEPKTGDKK